MPLPNFLLPNGSPNPDAVCVMTALNTCLWYNRSLDAQSILDLHGGGMVVSWNYITSGLACGWAVLQCGGVYHLLFNGTINTDQWLTNVTGAFATYENVRGAQVHSGFYDAWDLIRPMVLAALPSDLSMVDLTCSGHSRGGAVAQIAAEYFTSPPAARSVQLMTFGQPKTYTTGLTGSIHRNYPRVCNTLDVVPYVPGNGANIVLRNVGGLIGSNYAADWHWYGQYVSQDTSGNMNLRASDPPDSLVSLLRVINTIQGEHYLQAYNTNCLRAARRMNVMSTSILALEVVDAFVNGSPAPALPPPVPQTAAIDIPTANRIYFPGAGSILTPSNINTTTAVQVVANGATIGQNTNIGYFFQGGTTMASGQYKLCGILNNGTYGSTTSVIWNGGPDATDAAIRAAANNWIYYRSNLLGNTASSLATSVKSLTTPIFEFIRVSDAVNPRSGFIMQPQNAYNFGYSQSPAPDVLSTALSLRMPGVNAGSPPIRSYSSHQIIGQPDDCVVNSVYNGKNVSMGSMVKFDVYLQRYLNYLCDANNALGFMGLSRSETKKVANKFQVVGGQLQCTVTAHGYSSGDKVRLTNVDIIGFSGTYRVVVVDANTLALVGAPINNPNVPSDARVQRVQLADGTRKLDFYQFVTPQGGWTANFFGKISKKTPGRQILPLASFKRGKRRKRS